MIVDVATEGDVTHRIAAVRIAVLAAAIIGARAHQPGDAQAVVAALDVGDRGHAHRGAIVALAVAALSVALAIAVIVAVPVLGGGLRHGGGGALRHGLAVG